MNADSTASLLRQYEEQGYVIFRDVLDSETVREAQDHLRWLRASNPNRTPEELQNIIAGTDATWLNLISDPRLLDIAEMFVGPDIALFGAHYFCKPPHHGQVVLWHQDGSYWPLEPMDVVTLWLAVSDVDTENGCLRLIPGSHKMTLQEMQPNNEIDNVLKSGIDPSLVDESQAFDCVLKAGSVEVHHPNIIHGSNANVSDRERIGLAIRYIAASTRITQPGWQTFLLRGNAVPSVNEYWERPKYVEGVHSPFRGSESWK